MMISPPSGVGIGLTRTPASQSTGGQPAAVRLDGDFLATFDASKAMKALDTDGDGTVSDAEFAFYRAQKAARGEYIPSEGPTGKETTREQVARATVDVLLKRL